jgi:hypothetical protein
MSETTPESPERTPRHDGWTPERKGCFLDSLAAKGNVRLACRKVHLSPEAAYRLKRRDPAFARAWAAALVRAHDCGLAVLADRALDGVEEEVWHRGAHVGTRIRYDTRLLLAHLARLDKALEDEVAVADAARFDELVACLTGEFLVPGDLASDDDEVLPLDRHRAGVRAGDAAAALHDRREDEAADGDAVPHGEFAEEKVVEAYREARDRAEARWDAWVEDACDYVDWLTGWNREPPHPGLPGNPFPEPLERALQAAARPCESPAKSFPRTLSDVSTSTLARGLAGPASAFATAPRSPWAGRRASMR